LIVRFSVMSDTTTRDSTTSGTTTSDSASGSVFLKGKFNLYDEDLHKAVDHLWNNESDQAKALLVPHIDKSPRHALVYAQVDWFTSMLSQNTDFAESVLGLFNKALDLADQFFNDFPKSAIQNGLLPSDASEEQKQAVKDELELCNADGYMYSAMMLVMLDSRLKGIWRMRKAWSIYYNLFQRKTPAVDPEVLDGVRFGAGLFMYLMSWLPPMAVSLLKIVGFVSNRDLGQHLMELPAGSEGSIHQPLACFFLIMATVCVPHALADVNELLAYAKPRIDSGLARWPNGVLFPWVASYYTRKVGDEVTTQKYLSHSIDVCMATGKFARPPMMLVMDQGISLMLTQKFAEASKRFESINESKEKTLFQGTPHVLAAVCQHMLGNDSAAEKEISAVQKLKLKGKDKFICDYVLSLVSECSTGFSTIPYQMLYVRRDLAHMQPKTARSWMKLMEQGWAKESKDKQIPRDEELFYHFLHDVYANRAKGSVDKKALKDMREILKEVRETKTSSKRVVWCVVNAVIRVELAEIEHDRGNLDEAEVLLNEAIPFCTTDMLQNIIRPRATIGLDQIRAKRAKGAVSVVPEEDDDEEEEEEEEEGEEEEKPEAKKKKHHHKKHKHHKHGDDKKVAKEEEVKEEEDGPEKTQ